MLSIVKTKTELNEAVATTMRITNRNIFILAGFGVLSISIILSAIFLVAVIAGSLDHLSKKHKEKVWQRDPKFSPRNFDEELPSKPPLGKRIKLRFHAPKNAKEMVKFSLEDAKMYCSIRNKRLPVPRTEEEEAQMIKDMRILHKGCEFFVHELLESLVCIILGEEEITYYLLFTDYCEKDIWGLFECLAFLPEFGQTYDHVVESRTSLPREKIVGVVLLDRELIPRRLFMPNYHRFEGTWIFEVKYVLNYLDVL
uniref:Uncharacterized protein n=1 Tax=Strigamia maritima TaxID=126957 RepID=T1JAA5_STRMM